MSKQNLFIPALGKIYDKLEPLAIPLLRVSAGLIFVLHGFPKFQAAFFGEGLGGYAGSLEEAGFYPGTFWIWAAMALEFFGGIAIILGVLTRFFTFSAAVMMYLIVFVYEGTEVFFTYRGGIEYELVLAIIFTVLTFSGAGGYAVDRHLKKTF